MPLELVLSCQTCGGTLIYDADGKHARCKNCGNEYFFREEKSEALTVALNEANEYLHRNFFDDALMKFRPLRERYPDDAEVAWGMAMATYGIVFAKDDRTGKTIPTCSRTVKESILNNADYLAAIENAADEQRPVYEQTAAYIDRLQKKIKRAMEDEEDYDVFISFKAKDENGHPTKDSLVARNIYDELTKKGIKTFFSEVTLADRLGDDYEPIIFRALYSCKFFILVGTKEEYINAPWVKNEWTRFRDRAAEENLSGACFAVFDGGVDRALPRLFSAQGINLAEYPAGGYEKRIADNLALKLGIEEKKSEAEEELQRRLEEQQRQMAETRAAIANLKAQPSGGDVSASVSTVVPIVKRTFLFLEDGNWKEATSYCQKVLDQDPENAYAYLALLMVELKVRKQEDLANCEKSFEGRSNYKKAIRFADADLKITLRNYLDIIGERRRQYQQYLADHPLLAQRKSLQERKQELLKGTDDGHSAIAALIFITMMMAIFGIMAIVSGDAVIAIFVFAVGSVTAYFAYYLNKTNSTGKKELADIEKKLREIDKYPPFHFDDKKTIKK